VPNRLRFVDEVVLLVRVPLRSFDRLAFQALQRLPDSALTPECLVLAFEIEEEVAALAAAKVLVLPREEVDQVLGHDAERTQVGRGLDSSLSTTTLRFVTLILGISNRRQVVVMADRRFTVNGVVVDDDDDNRNKVTTLILDDARVGVAFTGLARAGDFSTDTWVVDAFIEAAGEQHTLKAAVEGFTERATAQWSRIRGSHTAKNTTFLFAGYRYEDPPRSFFGHVSNFEDVKGRPRVRSDRGFEVQWMVERDSSGSGTACVAVAGESTVLDDGQMQALVDMAQEDKPAHALIAKALAIGRRASERAPSIGKKFSSLVIPADPAQQCVGDFHHPGATTTVHVPNLIVSTSESGTFAHRGLSVTFETATGEPVGIPRVGRNDRCPCRSGLKYKRCHGR
jgi:hypothetical protein